MTEREIIERQELAGNQEYFLVLVGSFLHAYGNGAFALSRATGYRIMRKQRKWGEVLTVGFPIGQLSLVRDRLREAGGDIEQMNDKIYLFRGIDGTPDLQMVYEPAPKPTVPVATATPNPITVGGSWLAEEVLRFNLSMSTPMDAMLFIGTLQQRLNDNDACESSAGHGLQK
jgi:hypothetical protein